MGAAIELLVIPTVLITLVAIALAMASLSAKAIFAMAVALALFYFVVLSVARFMRALDDESEREIHAHR